MTGVRVRCAFGLVAGLAGSSAAADDIQWRFGDATVSLTGLATAGVAVRMQDRSTHLLGKTDVRGQETLCAEDDCMSLTGSPAPNERLIAAKGAFAGSNSDNGNLNYDQYDVVAAITRFSPTVKFTYGDFRGKVRGLFYYDPVNADFDESHHNTLYQPSRTSRDDHLTKRFARGAKLREAFVTYEADAFNVTVGNQVLTWGESLLTQFGSLNAINPYDANIARMPGAEISEYLQPVPAVTVGLDLGSGFAADVFYQLDWVPLAPDATGSFFSTSNVLGGGRFILLGLGQYSQDPDRQYRAAGLTRLISSSTRTAYLLDEDAGAPPDGGQFGAKLTYYADDLNDGTEFGFYYLHYHSRIPNLSAIAADDSCTRDGVPGSFASALAVCLGFAGEVNPIGGREPVPVDTLRPFLDYPEDIDMIGASFNTTALHWSIAGEVAYRPNQPVQIAFSDIIFAAESPAFPEEDIPVPVNAVGNAAPFTIPGHRTAAPDFLSGYRGITIGANDVIRGYERFDVAQFALVGLRQLSSTENWFRADAALLVWEISAEKIFDVPSHDRLQLEGAGDRTHHGPGADGTGDPNGEANSLRINPTQQTSGFATSWAYGWRGLMRLTYNNALGGANLVPAVIVFHDLGGISPANIPNYVSGRKTIYAMLDVELSHALRVGVQYQVYTGGGERNVLVDRDNLSASVSYSF